MRNQLVLLLMFTIGCQAQQANQPSPIAAPPGTSAPNSVVEPVDTDAGTPSNLEEAAEAEGEITSRGFGMPYCDDAEEMWRPGTYRYINNQCYVCMKGGLLQGFKASWNPVRDIEDADHCSEQNDYE